MEQIIRLMIEQAETEENYSLIGYVGQLINKYANTINCPSNWRDIGQELAKEYDSDTWVYEELELWNYVDEE